MDIVVAPRVERYLETLWPHPVELLTEIQQDAERRGIPVVGPVVGRLLEQLARLVHSRRVIELGSGIGYSGVWLARGMAPDGELHLTDDTPEFVDAARDYMRRLGYDDRVTVHSGDALEILQAIEGNFDIIFNDCEKRDYPRVYELARPRLRRGGLLLSDNVLWGGAVADAKASDLETDSIREYNRLITTDSGLLTTILPLRDGVSVSLVL
jgi:predicted O-methyltransferase YrrM